jgi:hypothetical protein
MSVYKKLNAVRLQLHAMPLKKSGYNSFGKWHYFELADFLVPALTLFEKEGLCGIVSSDGADMTLVVREVEGEGMLQFSIPLSSADLKGSHPVQNLGAVITYSRRYLWTLALELLEHDAIDAAEPAKEASKTVAAEAFDALDADTKDMLTRYADEVKKAFAFDSGEAFLIYEKHKSGMDSDTQVAFWKLFDSKQRSSIKAAGEAARKAA